MSKFKASWVMLVCAAALGGCAHTTPIGRIADDDNRAIANSRQEQLLLNILRSSAREPLQFSAVGEIATTVKDSLGLDTAATNLIAGGKNLISPTLKLGGEATPVVKVTPLSSKEFTDAILRPISPEVVSLFLKQGWDAEFLLPLIVSSYRCPGGELQRNAGDDPDNSPVRLALDAAAPTFDITHQTTKSAEPVTLVVSQARALEKLKTGLAGGYKIKAVRPDGDVAHVTVAGPDTKEWVATSTLCSAKAMGFAPGEQAGGELILRSVEGMIHFLGERLRPCLLSGQYARTCAVVYRKTYVAPKAPGGQETREYDLFNVRVGPTERQAKFVDTRFYGTTYWIGRLEMGEMDRTVKTVSFLNQLIALQTDRSALPVTPTVLSIGGN